MRAEPVRDEQEFLFTGGIPSALPEVVIAQAVLGDSDRVVLQPDVAVIVKSRNSLRFIPALIIRLFSEQHVVLAEFIRRDFGIFGRSLMPESKMTFTTEEICAEDASVVVERGQVSELKVADAFTGKPSRQDAGTTAGQDTDATISYYVTA